MTREEFYQRAFLAAYPECLSRAPGQEPRYAVARAEVAAKTATEAIYDAAKSAKRRPLKKASAAKG